MNEMTVHVEDFAVRCQKILGVARQMFQTSPDWVTFFREVLGVGGAARNVFPSQTDFLSFEKSTEFHEIQQMVNALRNRKASANGNNEPTRVITVRLPESLHEALKAEANDHNTSMNRLCISKLLQVLAEVPKGMASITNRNSMSTVPTQAISSATQTNFRSSFNPQPTGSSLGSPMGGSGLNSR